MKEPPEIPNSQTPEPSAEAATTPSPETTPKPEEGEPKPLVSGEQKPEPVEFVPLTAEDITFPEGLEVNETLRDEALAIVNNRELSPKEQLQGLVELQGRLAKEASEGISKTWEDTQKAWQDEVKVDPDIGGDKLQSTLSAVNNLVSQYGDEKLIEAFEMTGAGNNVHVIKFLNNIAGKLLEGGPVPATSPANRPGDAASRMFPSMKG